MATQKTRAQLTTDAGAPLRTGHTPSNAELQDVVASSYNILDDDASDIDVDAQTAAVWESVFGQNLPANETTQRRTLTGLLNTLLTQLTDPSDVTRGAALIGRSVQVVSDAATAATIYPIETRTLIINSEDGRGSMWFSAPAAAPGTYTSNGPVLAGQLTSGTVIAYGDGSAAWLRKYSGPANIAWFGAKGDWIHNEATGTGSGTNDTAAFIAAIAAVNVIELNEGNYYVDETLPFNPDTTLTGATIGGDHAGYKSVIYYKHNLTSSTLSADITDSQTTLPLVDASTFPSSGYLYLGDVNGEWCKWTGKSGNTLTGVTRGSVFTGDSAADTGIMGGTVVPQSYITGTKVTVAKPCIFREGIFRGQLRNLKFINASYIFSQNINEQPNGISWTDLGLAFYFDYGAYAQIINSCDFLGFEKVGFVGRSFVSTYSRFKAYYCRYGLHVINGNGLSIDRADTGLIGSSAINEQGWSFYIHKGKNTSISASNVSNGGYNNAIVIDSSPETNLRSVYIEACLGAPLEIKNGSVVKAKDLYLKDASVFARLFDTSVLEIDGISYDTVTLERVNALPGATGYWEVKNVYNSGTGAQMPGLVGIADKYYKIPLKSAVDSTELSRTARGSIVVPDNTATDFVKFTTRVFAGSGNNRRIIGFTVDYLYYSDYTSGAWCTQKGRTQCVIRNENDLSAPFVAIAPPEFVDLTSTSVTVVLSFSYRNDVISATDDGTYDTVFTITANNSNNTSGTLLYQITPMTSDVYDETGADNLGRMTLL